MSEQEAESAGMERIADVVDNWPGLNNSKESHVAWRNVTLKPTKFGQYGLLRCKP